MRRDISEVLLNHLGFFQSFDDVKVYYDNGQDIVKQALDRSVSQILSKGVVQRRKTSMTDYCLLRRFCYAVPRAAATPFRGWPIRADAATVRPTRGARAPLLA